MTVSTNPNTCDHGYRIETSICPVTGCVANSPGERLGDVGPVLDCGPAADVPAPSRPDYHAERQSGLDVQARLNAVLPSSFRRARFTLGEDDNGTPEVILQLIVDPAQVLAVAVATTFGLARQAPGAPSEGYIHHEWRGRVGTHNVRVLSLEAVRP